MNLKVNNQLDFGISYKIGIESSYLLLKINVELNLVKLPLIKIITCNNYNFKSDS